MHVDLKNTPMDWSLYDVAISFAIAQVSFCTGALAEAPIHRIIRDVRKAWYDDERSGFNAEHIEIGGEG